MANHFTFCHSQSCSSNQVYLDCGSYCGQSCINVCNGSYPNIPCIAACYEGCGCDSGTYWSSSMDCCLSKLDCVVYDSLCVALTNITNNYTLNDLASINISMQDIKQLQYDSDPDDYQCESGGSTGSGTGPAINYAAINIFIMAMTQLFTVVFVVNLI